MIKIHYEMLKELIELFKIFNVNSNDLPRTDNRKYNVAVHFS